MERVNDELWLSQKRWPRGRDDLREEIANQHAEISALRSQLARVREADPDLVLLKECGKQTKEAIARAKEQEEADQKRRREYYGLARMVASGATVASALFLLLSLPYALLFVGTFLFMWGDLNRTSKR